MNLNGTEYFYIRNGQGDIIGIVDGSGTQVVSYSYDTWGKLVSITGSLKDTVGVKNPYRYRGYRYDSETGLYYLQSRYYNPDWGRFVNADTITGSTGELLTANMFAYCRNNPVNHADLDGDWILDALFMAADVAEFVASPSVAKFGWVLLYAVSFADPTGIGSTVAHGIKAAHVMEETVHVVREAARAGELIGRYHKVKAAVKGMGLETHHLVEKIFARTLGVKPRRMLSVALTKEQHRIYTNRWAREIPHGSRSVGVHHIEKAIHNVYHDNEVLKHATLKWLHDVKNTMR
ncbi:RHS repeat-associated core domain-containing protein [Clostridium manihotivorum]|nr:RHS repeat-associated core domain-containing protein [Clostridium manihotivorum]